MSTPLNTAVLLPNISLQRPEIDKVHAPDRYSALTSLSIAPERRRAAAELSR
jgi:hypothetical protein